MKRTTIKDLARLRDPLGYSAIFTMSDELLFHCFRIIQQNRRAIPDDISLIAISDGILAQNLFPAITHIQDAGYRLGQQATSALASTSTAGS